MASLRLLFPKEIMTLPVLVAALGYFIDVYDIWIFGANRVASLTDLGVAPEKMLDTGVLLLDMQMAGLFLGGFVFGILGDKFGRTKMMFLSILTYSMATLLNGMVQSVGAYAVFRFVAGFGLAGELGLAVTLISETLPKEKRGYGTGIIVGFGVFGALAAAALAHYVDWRTSYFIGGFAGLALLAFRIKVHESALFKSAKEVPGRGKIRMIFNDRGRFLKFLYCVFMVLPVWYAAGVLVTFGPELIKSEYGYTIAAASLMVWFNLFLALSDFFSAWISQWLKSRKKVLFGFIALGFAMTAALLLSPYHLTLPVIIAFYVGVAFGGGCWVLGVTTAAESFGTNLRATVTTIVPNFSRAATIPMTLGLAALKEHMSLGHATMAVGAVVFTLALLGAALIPETHSKNLDYVEE